MASYRTALPQLEGGLFLTDAGLETDLIFNHDVAIPEFAAHTLLGDPAGEQALAGYLRGFLALAAREGTGFVLDSQTWRAQPYFAAALGDSIEGLRVANHRAVNFVAALRDEQPPTAAPVVLNGLIGPRGDAYAPQEQLAADEAERYHSVQLGWLAETAVDMVTALTFTQSAEAIGAVRAAAAVGLPIVVSFTVETDGGLPTGQPLGEAIEAVDAGTNGAPAYFMVNCAHPDHFASVLLGSSDAAWTNRVRGLRCNASRLSHAELDEAEVLDDGDAPELAEQYRQLRLAMPWLNVFGGCCGSDLRHVTAIASALAG